MTDALVDKIEALDTRCDGGHENFNSSGSGCMVLICVSPALLNDLRKLCIARNSFVTVEKDWCAR
jgi:hypothetical protein